MITFWLLALVLLVSALLLLLWPVLRVRQHQAEEDRTALNVALYQERLAELQGQLDQGTLSGELFEQGRLEAERELLDDTATGAPRQRASLGMTLPLIASLLVPVAGTGLYMVWGSSDQVSESLAQQPLMAQQQAVEALMKRIPTLEQEHEREAAVNELIGRLEDIVRLQPEAADVWFFLGRHYMGEQRHADAANAFARTMDVAGRQPEILAQWAQAQFFAGGNSWNADLQDAVDVILSADPHDATTLGFVGIAAFESGNFNVARDAWNRLLDSLDPRDPSAAAVLTGIERAEKAVAEYGEPNPAASAGPVLPALPDPATLSESGRVAVRISLAPELEGTLAPEASVFVFARSPQSGQLPLAAQRLTVADLPAEVVLSDADAVMSELQLSKAQDIKVQASIAADGNASAPDWTSATQDAVVDSANVLELVISQPAGNQ